MNLFKSVFKFNDSQSTNFSYFSFLDSPVNTNYVSIFTRKSTVKKKNLSIIKNSGNWKMLKIEVKIKQLCFDLRKFCSILRLNTKAQFILTYSMLLLMKIHVHFVSNK